MQRIVIALLLLSVTALRGTPPADACGGTLTSVSSGVRFMRETAKDRPASVLIFAPSSTVPSGPAQLQAFLKDVGHKPSIAGNVAALNEALKTGKLDVVVTLVRDASLVQTTTPMVVMFSEKPSKADKKSAEKKYASVIENPNDGDAYISAIHKVMKAKTSKGTQQASLLESGDTQNVLRPASLESPIHANR